MIEKDDTYTPKANRNLIILAIIIGVVGVTLLADKYYFLQHGESRYTIAEVEGNYRDSKVVGITYFYFVNGNKYTATCIYDDCKYLSKGTKYIVKFYVNRPDWTELYPEIQVPNNITHPENGWEEIPKW